MSSEAETSAQFDRLADLFKTSNAELTNKLETINAKLEANNAELTNKLDTNNAKLDTINAELNSKLDTSLSELNNKLDASHETLEANLNEVCNKIDATKTEMGKIDKRLMGHLHSINNRLENSISNNRKEFEAFRKEVRGNFQEITEKFSHLNVEVKEKVDKQLHEGLETVRKDFAQGLDNCCAEISAIKTGQRSSENEVQGLRTKLQEVECNLTKTAKIVNLGRSSCGGYKEEPKHLVFSGWENENPVQFLKTLELHIARVNPVMDNEDKFDIINRVLQEWKDRQSRQPKEERC